jgi:hypothetical protein
MDRVDLRERLSKILQGPVLRTGQSKTQEGEQDAQPGTNGAQPAAVKVE